MFHTTKAGWYFVGVLYTTREDWWLIEMHTTTAGWCLVGVLYTTTAGW